MYYFSDFTHWNSTCDTVIEPIIAVTDEELGKYEADRKTSITENLKKKKWGKKQSFCYVNFSYLDHSFI